MLPFALHPILAASAYETLHQFVSAYKVQRFSRHFMIRVEKDRSHGYEPEHLPP